MSIDKIGYFDEAPNHKSSMRLMSFLMMMSAIGFGAWAMHKAESSNTGVQLSVMFLTAAVSGKTISKFAEKEN